MDIKEWKIRLIIHSMVQKWKEVVTKYLQGWKIGWIKYLLGQKRTVGHKKNLQEWGIDFTKVLG